jgi:hypothetical protein
MSNQRPSDEPLSMKFWKASQDWVAHDSAARLLEELKTSTLSQMMMKLGDMPISRAEMLAKASDEYREYIRLMTASRTDANNAKVKMEYCRMKHSEMMSKEASERLEAKL